MLSFALPATQLPFVPAKSRRRIETEIQNTRAAYLQAVKQLARAEGDDGLLVVEDMRTFRRAWHEEVSGVSRSMLRTFFELSPMLGILAICAALFGSSFASAISGQQEIAGENVYVLMAAFVLLAAAPALVCWRFFADRILYKARNGFGRNFLKPVREAASNVWIVGERALYVSVWRGEDAGATAIAIPYSEISDARVLLYKAGARSPDGVEGRTELEVIGTDGNTVAYMADASEGMRADEAIRRHLRERR